MLNAKRAFTRVVCVVQLINEFAGFADISQGRELGQLAKRQGSVSNQEDRFDPSQFT